MNYMKFKDCQIYFKFADDISPGDLVIRVKERIVRGGKIESVNSKLDGGVNKVLETLCVSDVTDQYIIFSNGENLTLEDYSKSPVSYRFYKIDGAKMELYQPSITPYHGFDNTLSIGDLLVISNNSDTLTARINEITSKRLEVEILGRFGKSGHRNISVTYESFENGTYKMERVLRADVAGFENQLTAWNMDREYNIDLLNVVTNEE